MSTKSSSKFWKKFGLGKKTSSSQDNSRPPSIQSHAAPKDDSHSIKSKRFSGVFSSRKQSIHSMNRPHQLGTTDQDVTLHPPPLPSGSALDTDMDQNQAPSTTPPSQTTLGCQGEQSYQGNHVESSTPPSDSDLGKQQDDIELAFDVITHDEAEEPTADTDITPCTTEPSSASPSVGSTTPKRTSKSKSSSNLKKTQLPSKDPIKSRLRQPSRTSNTTAGSVTPSASSSSSSLRKETVTSRLPEPPYRNDANASEDQKDQQIQQLQEALQIEQSINRALQGQKEAITRDLDYFSLTVDELMEEKEALLQKFEEEKMKSQTKEEDLNVLLDKLKASTDSARERSMEVDHWKTELENAKEEAVSEQKEMKAALKRKDQEITQLKNDLATSEEEIRSLSIRLDHLVQEANQQRSPSQESRSPSSAIETPSASPRLDAHRYNDHDSSANMLDRFTIQDATNRTEDYYHSQQHKRTHQSTTPPPISTLDNELHMLTKEKEKLQSDYGKIPLSGGGYSARRRQERLEEMLDEVDSQLSKVKQKIRRS